METRCEQQRALTCVETASDVVSRSLSLQGDMVDQEGGSQSQASAAWLMDPKDSKRTISTKYETTIF